MERHEVIAVLESLATGVDPVTNQRIPLEAFQSEQNVRALSEASALLKSDEAALTEARRGRPVNPSLPAAGAPWTDEEDGRLGHEHDSGMTIAQIALKHGRTSGAITARLVKLGRIDASVVKTRQRGMQAAEKSH